MSSSRPIVLRVRTKEGQHRVDCLTSDSTVADLKGVLLSLSGGSIGRVLSGYPPTALTLSEESQTLEQAKVRSGDTLIIVEGGSNNGQTNAAQTKAATAQSRPAIDELNNVAASAGSAYDVTGNESVSRQGVLLRRTVPANNSCLFTSIYFALSGGEFNLRAGANLRQIIADAVAADAVTYSEAFLGKYTYIWYSMLVLTSAASCFSFNLGVDRQTKSGVLHVDSERRALGRCN